jgi:hypothetical protein
MKKIFVKVKRGKEISAKEIGKLKRIWKDAFGGSIGIISQEFVFVVYNSKGKILSTGRLLPVKIKFLNKIYKIYGIGEIVSVIERKGYGKILMNVIYRYLINRKLTGVGFCNRKNTIFYQKCGFRIAKNLVKRFIYKNPEGKLIRDIGDDDVFYHSGEDSFIEMVLSYPKKKVLIPCQHW